MRLLGFCLFFLFSIVSSFNVTHAISDLDSAFEALKESPEDFKIAGTVCEQVARLELEEQFPPESYTIENGITYTQDGRILGELDVVVFSKTESSPVVLIGEVKCWQNQAGALRKAGQQRRKFRDAIRFHAPEIEFYLRLDPSKRYQSQQFASHPPFWLISSQEGAEVGFDWNLSFSLPELNQLRQRLLKALLPSFLFL